MDRRSFVIGTAASATALAAGPSFAQDAFPSRNITILVAFPPGGANDIITRPVAAELEKIFKQSVVIENKAGAGGQVGAQVAANAKPDGYTLLSHNNGISGYAEVDKLFDRKPKTTREDFIPLARLAADPVMLLVNAEQPYKTVKEFIDDAKKRPEAIVYSSGGLYGATHLPVAIFEKATGIPKLRHLPTQGGGPAVTALLGNNAQMSTQTVSASLAHVRSGKLRALATFGGKRSPAHPDVPTLKELGFDAEYYLWVGLFAPKGTPPAVIQTLSAALDKASQTEAYKSVVQKIGQEYAYQNAKDFAAFWEADAKASDEAVKLIGRVG
ncbi:MAG: tripartite tricarboxylate transporter substrate binding protein [Pseudolabrys sp.]|nr:tripartite tricarboxylate transporter substrate binding protein [Pseudolabrys sp.]